MDIISAIEFDKSGDHLATGDRGGRVVLFERTDTKDVILILTSAIFLFKSPNLLLKDSVLCTSYCNMYVYRNMQHGGPRRDLERMDYSITRHPEFRYKTEFQSHEPEVIFSYQLLLPQVPVAQKG